MCSMERGWGFQNNARRQACLPTPDQPVKPVLSHMRLDCHQIRAMARDLSDEGIDPFHRVREAAIAPYGQVLLLAPRFASALSNETMGLLHDVSIDPKVWCDVPSVS